MKKINKNQVKKLRTVASKIFEDDQEYHDWLKTNYKVKSTLGLGFYEAIEAINLLEGNTTFVARNYRISRKQGLRISILENLLGWDNEPQRLLKFVDRQVKTPGKNIDQIRKDEAGKVIIGLQRILSRGSQDVYDWLNKMTNDELKVQREIIKVIYSDNADSLMNKIKNTKQVRVSSAL